MAAKEGEAVFSGGTLWQIIQHQVVSLGTHAHEQHNMD